jgi:uncharacterized protein YkwD
MLLGRKWKIRYGSSATHNMLWASLILLAASLPGGADPGSASHSPAAPPGSAVPVIRLTRNSFDADAERELLRLANLERTRQGLVKLEMDPGLTSAAREHAFEMAEQERLSHQFPNEQPLPVRLSTSTLMLDRTGENVAVDYSIERAQEALMLSPVHRENLMNPAYNVAGFAVVRRGERLYVVQDFAHGVPTQPDERTEDVIASAVRKARGRSGFALQRVDEPRMREAACSMARNDRLSTQAGTGALAVVGFTNNDPSELPDGARKLATDPRMRNFAVGSCFSRTARYPGGVYWVLLAFY